MSSYSFESEAYLVNTQRLVGVPQIRGHHHVRPEAIIDLLTNTPDFTPYRHKLETVLDQAWGTMIDLMSLGGTIGGLGKFQVGATSEQTAYLAQEPIIVTNKTGYRLADLPHGEIYNRGEIICVIGPEAEKDLFKSLRFYYFYANRHDQYLQTNQPSFYLESAFKNMFRRTYRQYDCPEIVAPKTAVLAQINAFVDANKSTN